MPPGQHPSSRPKATRARTRAPAGTARAYLAERSELGKKFGLDTILALLAALGHPERDFPALLVAGTNGKGSVVAYVDAALRASGLRTGLYTSPHLVRVNERIRVDGAAIAERDLDRAIGLIRDCAQQLQDRGALVAHPTYFEALTAAAFLHFERRRVDVAVLEVGLGGRLDATNACEPVASAIVSIDYDHEAFLGSSLASIAREKAGVLRRGRECVVGPLPRAASAAIARAARATGARLQDAMAGVALEAHGTRIDVRTPEFLYRRVRPLPGAHQTANLVVALRLLAAAARAGIAVDFAAVPAAVSRTRWPGRLQTIPGRPRLVLDGAHNPAGARALAAHLRTLRPFVLLFGVMADKRVESIAAALFPLAERIVLTRPPGRRAATPGEIALRSGSLARGARRASDPGRALALACKLAGPTGTVVVAGSLYLVGAILQLRRPAQV